MPAASLTVAVGTAWSLSSSWDIIELRDTEAELLLLGIMFTSSGEFVFDG